MFDFYHLAAYRNWIYMQCSDSGQYVAGIDVRNVFVSSDYGASYALTFTSQLGVNLTSITMDSQGGWFCLCLITAALTCAILGQYMSVSTVGGGILVSSQYGALGSWTTGSAPLLDASTNAPIGYGQVVSDNAGDVLTAITAGSQGVYSTVTNVTSMQYPTIAPSTPTFRPSPVPTTKAPILSSSPPSAPNAGVEGYITTSYYNRTCSGQKVSHFQTVQYL